MNVWSFFRHVASMHGGNPGGIQLPMESRMHDLSDGFVMVGPMSQAKKIGNISTTAVQLRSDDGVAFVEIDPGSKNIRAKTSSLVSIEAPDIHLTGNVTITGTVTQSGGNTAMTGNVSVNRGCQRERDQPEST